MKYLADQATRPKLTWQFGLLVNISLVAFYSTTRLFEALLAMVLISLSLLTPLRLPRSATLAAAMRLGFFTVIVLHVGIPSETFSQWYMKPGYTALIGCLLVAEAALRAWEPGGGLLSGDPRGIMFFVSALLIAAAANTAERFPMNWIAPAYVAVAVIALRSFENRGSEFSIRQAFRLSAVALFVAGGYQLVRGINQYDEVLNTFVERLLYQQRRPMQIGLSASPRVGWIFNPLQQADRVMLVEGSLTERYLAAAEFDQYSAQQWGPSVSSRAFLSVDPRTVRSDRPGTRLSFTRVGNDLNLLPMPMNTVSVESTAGVEQDDYGALRHTEENLTGGSSQYAAVVSIDERAQGPLTVALTNAQRKEALRLPDNFNPAATQLARNVSEGAHDENAVIRLSSYLRSKHGYSLRYRTGGPEAISNFILSEDPAHCVLFASSLVMMCRASGIPARMVTGYYAWEYFAENTLVVRSRDAHAWAEVWIEGVGWLTYDATPAGGRPDSLNQPTSWLQRTWERITDWPGQFRDWVSQFSETAIVGLFIGLAGVMFLFFLIRVIWTRRRAIRMAQSNQYALIDRQLSRAARRFNRWLAQRGCPCEASRSWRQCLGDAPETDDFLNAYETARFGKPTPDKTAEALRRLTMLESRYVSRSSRSAITLPDEGTSRGR